MPYKIIGTSVYVKREGRWELLAEHPTVAAARKHLAALYANVSHVSGKRKKSKK